MDYHLIRSKRKTISVEVGPNGLTVRAPLHASVSDIEAFLHAHSSWITSRMDAYAADLASFGSVEPLSEAEISLLKTRASSYIPARVAYYAELMGVTYSGVSIRKQRSRWGSCSEKKHLNFNCLLMLCPVEVIDSVVVHELCHLVEMNHSVAFYKLVYQYCPDYDACDAWLKKYGKFVMMRGVTKQS